MQIKKDIQIALYVALLFFVVITIGAFGSHSVEAQEKQFVVKLYGQNFTIKPEAVNVPGEPYQWRDTAYLIKEVLPGAFGDSDPRTLEQILETLGRLNSQYQNQIYECSIYNLAQDMDDEGMLDAAFLMEKRNAISLTPIPERFKTGTKQERVDALYAAVGYWIARDSWPQYVDAYNLYRGETVLSPLQFETPHRMYKYARALYNLNVVIRQSPEIQSAGLERYGVVKPRLADCFKDIGPQDYSKKTLEGKHRDRSPSYERGVLSP